VLKDALQNVPYGLKVRFAIRENRNCRNHPSAALTGGRKVLEATETFLRGLKRLRKGSEQEAKVARQEQHGLLAHTLHGLKPMPFHSEGKSEFFSKL
jgi:hypothetical protein